MGKSSTINVLMGEKKTGVTSTPGKTKHFQTLLLNDELMACDCPGLVLPSFVMSKGQCCVYIDVYMLCVRICVHMLTLARTTQPICISTACYRSTACDNPVLLSSKCARRGCPTPLSFLLSSLSLLCRRIGRARLEKHYNVVL